MTREQAITALKLVADAVVEVVAECPDGAPAGPMYAAFMQYGMSLDTFEQITDALVQAGKIRKCGHLFFPVEQR
jgi:hypothetical protein